MYSIYLARAYYSKLCKHKRLTCNVYVVDSCIYHGRIGAQAQSSTSVLLYEP